MSVSTRNEGGSPEEWNTPQTGSFWQPPPEPEGPRGAPRFRHCRRAHHRCSRRESERDRERMTSLAASTPTVVKVWTIMRPLPFSGKKSQTENMWKSQGSNKWWFKANRLEPTERAESVYSIFFLDVLDYCINIFFLTFQLMRSRWSK